MPKRTLSLHILSPCHHDGLCCVHAWRQRHAARMKRAKAYPLGRSPAGLTASVPHCTTLTTYSGLTSVGCSLAAPLCLQWSAPQQRHGLPGAPSAVAPVAHESCSNTPVTLHTSPEQPAPRLWSIRGLKGAV